MTTHANRGVGWERTVERWTDSYRKVRPPLAVVFRTPPEVTVLGKVVGGRFRACWRGEGPPDYAGVIVPAVPVAFDAKDCDGPTWSFSSLERHQARDLEAWSGAGGYAFVALRLAGEGWVLPWSELGTLWWTWHERAGRAVRGTASIGRDGCREIGLRMPELGDWLGALRDGGVV